jgi:hypothetical protein
VKTNSHHIGICVVHGHPGQPDERESLRNSWPRLQIDQLRKHTPPGYKVFVLGYSRNGRFLPEDRSFLESCPEVEYIPATDIAHGQYPFKWPLMNWLVRHAANSCDTIVHMDFDTFPISDNWLDLCTSGLGQACPLASVCLTELGMKEASGILSASPTEALFRVGMDFSPVDLEGTGARMSTAIDEAGLQWKKLTRSNPISEPLWTAGIYNNCVYHHGAYTYEPSGQYPTQEQDVTDEQPGIQRKYHFLTERLFNDTDTYLEMARTDALVGVLARDLPTWSPPPYPISYNRYWRFAKRTLQRLRPLQPCQPAHPSIRGTSED